MTAASPGSTSATAASISRNHSSASRERSIGLSTASITNSRPSSHSGGSGSRGTTAPLRTTAFVMVRPPHLTFYAADSSFQMLVQKCHHPRVRVEPVLQLRQPVALVLVAQILHGDVALLQRRDDLF